MQLNLPQIRLCRMQDQIVTLLRKELLPTVTPRSRKNEANLFGSRIATKNGWEIQQKLEDCVSEEKPQNWGGGGGGGGHFSKITISIPLDIWMMTQTSG